MSFDCSFRICQKKVFNKRLLFQTFRIHFFFDEIIITAVPANRSPTRQKSINKSLLSLDKTQEFSETSQKLKIDGENRSENHRNAVILSGYSSRRVQYKSEWAGISI